MASPAQVSRAQREWTATACRIAEEQVALSGYDINSGRGRQVWSTAYQAALEAFNALVVEFVDKARAWDVVAEKNVRIAELKKALALQTEQQAYPCSPHCAGYLKEQALRDAVLETLFEVKRDLLQTDHPACDKIEAAIAQAKAGLA